MTVREQRQYGQIIETSNSTIGFDLATVDKLLTTTRSVRRRLDLTRPVPTEVVLECLRLAIHATNGSNAQAWRWLIIRDPEQRRRLAMLYQNRPPQTRTPRIYWPAADDPEAERRNTASSEFLRTHLQDVPVLVVPCILDAGGPAGWAPSIYPAVWSFMLALRSRGLGTVLTTAHLNRKDESQEFLGVPPDYVQACLLPVAYYTGDDFKPGPRHPIEDVCFVDRWDGPL